MHNGRALEKADPSAIQDKLPVGYQGWFTCTGDGQPGKPSGTQSFPVAGICLLCLDSLDLHYFICI
jgi:hypothetical protein